jgi:hypothetical protein
MKKLDKVEFLKAIDDELDGHLRGGNHEMLPRRKLPKDALVLSHV